MGNVNGIGGWKEGHNSFEDMPCDLVERCRRLGETAASCGEFSETLAPFLLSARRWKSAGDLSVTRRSGIRERFFFFIYGP